MIHILAGSGVLLIRPEIAVIEFLLRIKRGLRVLNRVHRCPHLCGQTTRHGRRVICLGLIETAFGGRGRASEIDLTFREARLRLRKLDIVIGLTHLAPGRAPVPKRDVQREGTAIPDILSLLQKTAGQLALACAERFRPVVASWLASIP